MHVHILAAEYWDGFQVEGTACHTFATHTAQVNATSSNPTQDNCLNFLHSFALIRAILPFHKIENPRVGGSIPPLATISINTLQIYCF